VITVYQDVSETDLRSDQTDPDAQRYAKPRTTASASQAPGRRAY
jgi:hypothetical protein